MHKLIGRQLTGLLVRAAACCLIIALTALAGPGSLVRDSIPEQYRWDLGDIYANWDLWETDFAEAAGLVDSFATLQGTPSAGAGDLLSVLQFRDRIGMMVDRLSLFAGLCYVTAMADNDLNARYQRIQNLEADLAEASSWLEPELLRLPWDTVERWLDDEDSLAVYRYWLENTFRLKQHYLDEEQEKLLSYFGGFNNSPDGIYSGFVYSDIQYPSFELASGDTILLSESQAWYQMRVNRDQSERQMIFRTFYQTYHTYVNTYAAIYNSVLQRDWALARARNYETALQAALDYDNVPVGVYENLVSTVRQGTEPLQRYHRMRRRALGLEHYYWSDRQAPLVELDRAYEYDETVPWMIEATAVLGEGYTTRLKQLFERRRVDVYENEDKYTGAFQSDAYGTPQYILMNFDGTLEEVFTLAHEAGHAMHSNYSNSEQAYVNAYSTIFVAEVPSTLNEALLLDYLMERTATPQERIAMLQRAIENIEGTFFLQTMFADFEWQAHQLVEEGEPITAEALRSIYAGLLADYYGDAIEMDSLYHSYWTRIGHFVESPYYVYKYATSLAASAELVKGIQSDNPEIREPALVNYLSLLRAGGNDYPMSQLMKSGVDLSTPRVVRAVVVQLGELVDRLEIELDKL
jgi:oligoendopeptidase F